MSPAERSSKAGFSLTEVMIASMIFLIVSIGFTGGMVAALRTHSMSADHYRATALVRNRIQRAKTIDFDSVSLMAETMVPVDQDGNLDSSGNARFKRSTIVTNISANVFDIEVDVYFPRPLVGTLSEKPVHVRTQVYRGM